MCRQELNIIVTIKRARQVCFQIAPMPKEKLQSIEGLQLGQILEESPRMKCKKCEDPVEVNLFYTKSEVVIENYGPKVKKSTVEVKKEEKPRKKRQKIEPKLEPEIVEVKQEPEIEIKTEPEVVFDEVEQKNESEAESENYEIPSWCAPKVEETKKKRERNKDSTKRYRRRFVLCHICSKEVRQCQLKAHLVKHEVNSNKPYGCNECGKYFCHYLVLQDHLIAKHFPWLAPFLCPHCATPFARQAHLKKHLYDKHRIGPTQEETCPHCKKVYSSKGSLRTHIAHMHSDPAQRKQFVCNECSKVFFKKGHFELHVRIHLPEDQRPFKCECGKSFINPAKFREHKLEHENPAKIVLHTCEVCQKSFKYSNSLLVHMRLHTGEQPYECEFCQRKFSDRSNHRAHMKQHENQMGIKLTLTSEERRLINHKVLKPDQVLNKP
ncbi:zinc finger protein 189-like [Culicoides brevitarsis]|uniref:zinc finger protein 189-like n=1 Tax=Culicoides brevitarsis TaxID=469753 RepID=UPI00307C8228